MVYRRYMWNGIELVCVIFVAMVCLLHHLPTNSGSSASFMNGSASSMALWINSVSIIHGTYSHHSKSQYFTSLIFICNCI